MADVMKGESEMLVTPVRHNSSDLVAKEAIICLTCDRIGSCDVILAGGEEGTVYKWNIEDKDGAAKRMSQIKAGDDSVNCICVKNTSIEEWFVGCGTNFVLIKSDNYNFLPGSCLALPDEVNAISVNDKCTFAAAADDSGCLTLIDLKSFKIHKKLLGHENICSTVKFRPKSPWSVITGGLDSLLILWDFKKGQALGSVNMNNENKKESQEDGDEKNSYVVNPPLIHALDISSDGLIATVALENGKIMFFTIGGKGFKLSSVVDAHSQGVSCLHLLPDMMLFTAGNDMKLSVYKISTARAPGKTLVWASNKGSTDHTAKPSGITVSADGSRIWIADETMSIACYKYES